MEYAEGTFTDCLRRVKWQAFVTFTFKGTVPNRHRALAMFRNWCDTIESSLECRGWYWFCRPELGETTGRFHLHALIGGLPPRALYAFESGTRNKVCVWLARACGFGLVTTRLMQSDDDALSYVGYSDPSNAYESLKTARTTEPTLSPKLLRLLRSTRDGRLKGQSVAHSGDTPNVANGLEAKSSPPSGA